MSLATSMTPDDLSLAESFMATCHFCGDRWPANDGRWTGERFDCGQCVRGMARTGGD